MNSKNRESAAEIIGARQWWSFFKGLGSWPGRGLGRKASVVRLS